MARQSNFVSILNNDDNPSFAVRSTTPRLTRHHSSSSAHTSEPLFPYQAQSHQSQRHSDYYYPFDPVRVPSPGSSVGSHDYAPSSCGSYLQSNPSESYAYSASSSTGTAAAGGTTPSEHRYSRTSPVDPPSPQTSSSVSTSKDSPSASKRGIRKNKYPCPYATSHNCSATFTTSGHAARHGKKHTGEKSVLCPVCNKAFTRKDNMKQHIRTHSEDMRQQQQQQQPQQAAAGSEGGASPSAMSPSGYHLQHHRKSST